MLKLMKSDHMLVTLFPTLFPFNVLGLWENWVVLWLPEKQGQVAENRKGEEALRRAGGTAGPLLRQMVLVWFYLPCFYFLLQNN